MQTRLQGGYYPGDHRYPPGLGSPHHWLLTWYPQDLHQWGPFCHIQTQLLLVFVMVVSSLQRSGLYMGMGSDIGGLADMCHGCTNVYLGFDLLTKCHHLVELWENFLQMCHLWRTDLCLVGMYGGDSYGAALAKKVLLLCRLNCYMMYWSVIDIGHWVWQGSLLGVVWLWWVEL